MSRTEDARTILVTGGAGFIGSNQGVYAPPREYGLELRYHFGG